MDDLDDMGVFLALDVGETNHHGRGLTPVGKKVLDKWLPNSEPKSSTRWPRRSAPCW
ncbi:hypothetical protein [Streptomyces sp. NBC_00151]|uniref:hypothetical protein n=1 Tax=Streptomyces sp. NBC_00151 TaxID=2975669 RepID=UPI002DD9C603|nr:hypothetical protein [Streptomyces sp. NBC_00151]